MANISKIKILNGTEYNLVDSAAARAADLGGLSFSLSNNDALLVTHSNNTITAATNTTLGEISTAIGGLADAWHAVATSGEGDDGESGNGGNDKILSGVKFIDYDGTVLHTFSTANAFALTSLPANPVHTGLTSQGWNWDLEDIKTYLAKYPTAILTVGQMYVTDDGKTRIYIHLNDERKSPMLGVCPNGTVDVDWGDGTTHDTLTGTSVTSVKWTPTHNYSSGGDYVIKLTVTGSMGFYGTSTTNQYSGILRHSSATDTRNRYYHVAVKKVEIGSNVTDIAGYAFANCYVITSITIPQGVTSIGSNTFNACVSLTGVTIPNGVTSIGNYAFGTCASVANMAIPNSVTSIGNYAIYSCYAVTSIAIPDGVTSIGDHTLCNCNSVTSIIIPDSVTSIEQYAFYNCYALTNIIIPDSVTSIGQYAFNYCQALTSVTIPDGVTSIRDYTFSVCSSLTSITIPNSVTSIGKYAFNGCYSLVNITIPSSVTSIGIYAFQSCNSLQGITIPSGVTSIGDYTFAYCYSITSITIPNSVTSIGGNVFYSCYALTSITIPSSVTSIGASTFGNCYGMAEYHITCTTPPTLASSSFVGISADCVIYVPYSEDHSVLTAYQNATNWSTCTSFMQEEPT